MKYITVPINILALQRLMYNEASQDELIEITLNQEQINKLFSSDFFEKINYILDINIDDFENEEITDIKKLIILRNFLRDWIQESPEEIYKQIFDLVSIAIERETGIFFFF
ncbi:hypothetical protein [Neisseria arctica]|uniref:hypothetical protein n=1 Tax=Neisseria arctica TaxID=1470200 RepID=UPI00069963E1|nr:hypothetical protein [Neisseria arctica]UOO87149.1 hypothetical protein LVJ86_02545 [Neisseria arctica]